MIIPKVKQTMYFTQETEDAIVEYNTTVDNIQRYKNFHPLQYHLIN